MASTTRVTASQFQKAYGRYASLAKREAVTITNHGRAELVVLMPNLWWGEHRKEQEEGAKDRPCAVVYAVENASGKTLVYVLPITHTKPFKSEDGMEMLPQWKQHLGLDDKSVQQRFEAPQVPACGWADSRRDAPEIGGPTNLTAYQRKIVPGTRRSLDLNRLRGAADESMSCLR